ncbi:hypothetical protein NFI96_015042 [Prochilodus magdalenae]|nr:hypothetical protein NFI96_015042 [Prochilodus magdalenae]
MGTITVDGSRYKLIYDLMSFSFINDEAVNNAALNIPGVRLTSEVDVLGGEVAFRAMSNSLLWAKRPMLDRIHLLPPDLPVTLVYGGQSWMDSRTGERVAQLRPNSYTRTVVVEGAPHHLYADKFEAFNAVVRSICDAVD